MNVIASLSDDDGQGVVEEDRRSELVGSFEKGLLVIRALADAAKGMTLTEVAEATGTTRASARRYLMTLMELGYAEQIHKRFELTPEVVRLVGTRFDAGLTWRLARPQMERLVAEIGESCSAAVRDRTDVVCVAHVDSPRLMSFRFPVGSRLPALPTALGRVVLMELSEDCLRDVIAAAQPRRFTPFTKIDPSEILEAMAAVREDGYAIVDQEYELGLRSIAVPVRNATGRVFAGLNISAEASRVELRAMAEDLLGPLEEVAATLSRLNTTA